MFILYWPIIIIVTVILYGLILLFLPFNQVYSTISLFALVGFWSRLPGVGMPSPFYVLYFADFVDFFSLIVAVNIGGFEGAIFSVFLNLTSRACGVFPSWLGVAKDTLSQFVVCLIIPYVYLLTGGDIFVSMIWYSVLRILMFFPMRLLPVETSFPQFLVTLVGAGTAVLAINAVYAKLFGDFFDGLLKSGVKFNFILFLFVTVIILAAKIYFFGHSKSKRISFRRILFGSAIRKVKKHRKRETIKHSDNDLAEMQKIKDMFDKSG